MERVLDGWLEGHQILFRLVAYFFIFIPLYFLSLNFSHHIILVLHDSLLVDDVHRLCLAYVASCVEMSITYKVLKPHLSFIIFSVVFPTLCLSPADIRYAESVTITCYFLFIVTRCQLVLLVVTNCNSLLVSVT